MDFTEKDLKNKLKNELVRIAKKMPGYNSKTHNKKDILIAFLLKKDIEIKPSKKDLLLEKASKYVDFKKTIHGSSIAKLEAFLKSKEMVEKTKQVEKEEQDITKLAFNDLKKLAKKHGWAKKTGTKKELIEFIKNKDVVSVPPVGRLVETEPPVVVEVVEEDIEEWPVSPEILAKHSKTVDDMKKLLKAKGIASGLPRTKKEIMELFNKSRCSFKDFTCSGDEFCDLRNNLCRELNILRNKDKEIKKFAKGLVYIDEEKGRFYGTPDTIAKVRQALLHPPTVQEQPPAQQQEESKEEVIIPPITIQQKEEEGISPININRLLDKPSENEIRRAILHCLGLYHDVDPNDEIILSST
jgi:hypothetical protein